MLNSCLLASKLHPFYFQQQDCINPDLEVNKTHVHATLDPQMCSPSENVFKAKAHEENITV